MIPQMTLSNARGSCRLPYHLGIRSSWQSNASLCGPSSLANVFRSFGEEAASERSVLAGTGLCWTGFCIMGLTLNELLVLRRVTRRSVTVLRDMSAEEFREHLKRSNDLAHRNIINFDRKMTRSWGSPSLSDRRISRKRGSGFRAGCQSRLPSMLVERTRLFDAMNTWDGEKTWHVADRVTWPLEEDV